MTTKSGAASLPTTTTASAENPMMGDSESETSYSGSSDFSGDDETEFVRKPQEPTHPLVAMKKPAMPQRGGGAKNPIVGNPPADVAVAGGDDSKPVTSCEK